MATDLHTFNSSLSTTIEQEVVNLLNKLREDAWDRQGRWAHYGFERQSQRFPDVILTTHASNTGRRPILMGIELKGWYVLAKEGEPSYRFRVTPAVATELDLIAVFPWAFSNVIAGTPFLYEPYIEGAKYAAAYRNWHWQHAMSGGANRTVIGSTETTPYPEKSAAISDRAVSDTSNNFGRFARTGLMDSFKATLDMVLLAGIPIHAWRRFLKVCTDDPTPEAIDRLIAALTRERRRDDAVLKTPSQIARFRQLLEDIENLIKNP